MRSIQEVSFPAEKILVGDCIEGTTNKTQLCNPSLRSGGVYSLETTAALSTKRRGVTCTNPTANETGFLDNLS